MAYIGQTIQLKSNKYYIWHTQLDANGHPLHCLTNVFRISSAILMLFLETLKALTTCSRLQPMAMSVSTWASLMLFVCWSFSLLMSWFSLRPSRRGGGTLYCEREKRKHVCEKKRIHLFSIQYFKQIMKFSKIYSN